jgi:hypothetical protein
MRDPLQPASIDMGLHIGNGVSIDAADNARDVPHHPNIYVTDVPRDGSVAPERWYAESSNYTDGTLLYLGQSASIKMGPRTGNSGGPPNAADDTEEVPHRPNVYVTDVSHGDSVAPDEHRKRIDSRPSTWSGLCARVALNLNCRQ